MTKSPKRFEVVLLFSLLVHLLFTAAVGLSGNMPSRPKRHAGKRPGRHSKAKKQTHIHGHSPLKMNPEFTVNAYRTLKMKGNGNEVKEYVSRFYDALQGEHQSVAVSKFLSLLRREQAFEHDGRFDKEDIAAMKKAILEDHVKAIYSPEMFQELLDLSVLQREFGLYPDCSSRQVFLEAERNVPS